MDLTPDEMRTLADIIERLNGDAFEIDAETRPGPVTLNYPPTGGPPFRSQDPHVPRFGPFTIKTICLLTDDGRVFGLHRDPETLLFSRIERRFE